MTRQLNFTAQILAVLLVSFVGAATVLAQDTIQKRFSVEEGGTLQIDIDYGTVSVEPSSGTSVHVELFRRVKGVSEKEEQEILEKHEYTIESKGNDVVVESRFDTDSNGLWRKWKNDSRFTLEVTIRVPEIYNVDFKTGAGNIQIADLQGTVRGKTGAGNIILGDIRGDIDISSGAGNIEVDGAQGLIYAESGAGNITLDKVEGKLQVGTGAGNVVATIVRKLSGESELKSGAGNVTVYLEDGVGADVDGQASIGSAKTEYDLKVNGKWMSKSFSGSVNGGGHALSMHSGVGNVILRRY